MTIITSETGDSSRKVLPGVIAIHSRDVTELPRHRL